MKNYKGFFFQLLYQFEDYVLILFRDDRKLKYLYMFTLLKHFVHAIAYTGNTYKFDMCISYVYTQYEGAERALQPVYIRNVRIFSKFFQFLWNIYI